MGKGKQYVLVGVETSPFIAPVVGANAGVGYPLINIPAGRYFRVTFVGAVLDVAGTMTLIPVLSGSGSGVIAQVLGLSCITAAASDEVTSWALSNGTTVGSATGQTIATGLKASTRGLPLGILAFPFNVNLQVVATGTNALDAFSAYAMIEWYDLVDA